jgi:hypothetical protein
MVLLGCSSHTELIEPEVAPVVARNDDLEIERIAALAILDGTMLSIDKNGAVALHPGFAPEGHAPGIGGTEMRPSDRTLTLARALRGTVSVERNGVDLHLSLSKPRIEGEVAQISVTLGTRDPRPRRNGYETIHYTLRRDGERWRIVKSQQLGIT